MYLGLFTQLAYLLLYQVGLSVCGDQTDRPWSERDLA